ncbi:MAG: flagellar basal body-associated FliL family protein [Thalassovita sp.]
MATTTADPNVKSSKRPLMLGLVLGILGGVVGFYAAYQGLLPLGNTVQPTADATMTDKAHSSDSHAGEPSFMAQDISFVPIPPLLISLGPASASKHLRFAAQLETEPGSEKTVEALMPRIVDVLNSYLRAVETADFDDTAILIRLRVQMLRRVQLVVGPGHVRDLLIMEFIFD